MTAGNLTWEQIEAWMSWRSRSVETIICTGFGCDSMCIGKQTTSDDEKVYTYLEQVRDFIHKDVVLADAKAGLSLTIVAGSFAAYASQLDKLTSATNTALQIACVKWSGVFGLAVGVASVLCAILTILPRAYISHEIAIDQSHWIHLRGGVWHSIKRRTLDAIFVVSENIWQRQAKGTTQSLTRMLTAIHDRVSINDNLRESMQRALLVQNLKFLWVGKALLLSFIAWICVVVAFVCGQR